MYYKKNVQYIKSVNNKFKSCLKSSRILKRYSITLSQVFWVGNIKIIYKSLENT